MWQTLVVDKAFCMVADGGTGRSIQQRRQVSTRIPRGLTDALLRMEDTQCDRLAITMASWGVVPKLGSSGLSYWQTGPSTAAVAKSALVGGSPCR